MTDSRPTRPVLPAAFRLVCYDTIGSTNDEARRLARDGAPEGTLIWALEQSAGRGRRGRVWVSPRGNLFASLVLRPQEAAARAAQLGFVAALALGDALDPLLPAGLEVRYKWPNDVLANGRKLAGILLESETRTSGKLDFLVAGLGVNLVSSPPDVEFPATSLAAEGAAAIAPAQVLALFAPAFERWVQRWRGEGFAPVRAAWLGRAILLGEAIRVRLQDRSCDGRFLDLDEDGALVFEGAAGPRRVTAGEVFPADSRPTAF